MALSFLAFAVPVFAQGGEAGWRNQLGRDHRRILHGDCLAVCGLAQAKATAAAAEGLARNPAARPGIQLALILGLALIESLALYTLVIIFVKVVITVFRKSKKPLRHGRGLFVSEEFLARLYVCASQSLPRSRCGRALRLQPTAGAGDNGSQGRC